MTILPPPAPGCHHPGPRIDLRQTTLTTPPMSPSRFLPAALAALGLMIAATGYASDIPAKIESIGDNTYAITVQANNKFTRNTEKLKARATDEADAFCAKQGKHLKIISVTEDKSLFLVGPMASATLTFKALDLADPELAKPAPAAGVDPAAAPVTNEALYADLLRLDDLRKKGILTQDEFQAEKKKLLERSR